LAAEGTLSDALMVCAAMIQKPELFKFVILFNGIYDLTKIKSMSPDSKHVLEYGDPDKLADFQNLLSYAPYYNLKENINYPTVILTAEDESSRFPLFHSYKLTARLQNRLGQKNPICLFAHTPENHKEDSTKKKTYHRYSGIAKYYQSILDICGE
jgi:prolyl oligopeptidase